MIHTTDAYVLTRTRLRETSLITTFYSESFGKIKTITKGVRRESSDQMSCHEPFAKVSITFYEKIRSDIHFLSESTLIDYGHEIRSDLARLAWSCFITELSEHTLAPHERDDYVYQLMAQGFQDMKTYDPSWVALQYGCRLLEKTGIWPEMPKKINENESYQFNISEGCVGGERRSEFSPEAVIYPVSGKTLQWLQSNEALSSEKMPPAAIRVEMFRFLYRWVYYRFERELKSLKFIRDTGLVPKDTAFPVS